MKREITIKLGDVFISNTRGDGAFVEEGYAALTLLDTEDTPAREEVVDALALIDALKDYLYVTVGENDE